MQAGVGLLVSDVMHIYMIIPSYSDNYAQFCQLLNSNLFTHRKILMLLREAIVKLMAPGTIFYHICFQSTFICIFTFPIYITKYQNIFILSYYLYQISLSQVAMKGLTTPLLRWLRVLVCLCRCVGLLRSLLLD